MTSILIMAAVFATGRCVPRSIRSAGAQLGATQSWILLRGHDETTVVCLAARSLAALPLRLAG